MIDIGQADVLISEIVAKQRQLDSLESNAKRVKEAQIAAITEKIDKWLTKETEPLRLELENLKAMLLPFVEEELKNNTKSRSVDLPSGRAGFRKGATVFSIADPGVYPAEACAKVDGKSPRLLEIVQQHGLTDYICTKEVTYAEWGKLKRSLSVTDEGKVVTQEGEILPELTATVEPDSFYVKATAEGGVIDD